MSYLEEALQLAPIYPYTKTALGGVYAGLGEMETAWQLAHEVLALDPASADALILRSLLFEESGRTSRMLADLSLLLSINPRHAYAYALRAQEMLWQGQYEAAREDATLALQYDPYDAENAHYVLAVLAMEDGDLETAADHIDQYTALGLETGYKYSIQAEFYLDMSRPEDALNVVDTGLALQDEAVDQLYLDRVWVNS
ncbi:MAG: hypothetical protein R3E31_14235 [Chloroflexota bacterium]